MRKTTLVFTAAILVTLAQAAAAQSMVEAFMKAQTQMHLNKDGEVEACGMRVTGFHDAGSMRDVFDTSLTVRIEGFGLGKLTGMTGPANNKLDQFESAEIYGGWFRKQGGKPTAPLKPYFSGEDSKSKLFIADVAPTIEVLDAIVTEQPIHISISWHEGNSTIYYGTAALEDSQKKQFWQCFDDLTKAMKKAQ